MKKTLLAIPFNKPSFVGNELDYIKDAVLREEIAGDGVYSKRCQKLMEEKFGATKILLTTSCTHALELASILLNLKEGDEVIVPSFTFVSTVNAFMLRGAKPVFVDIRMDTKNINENLIEEKITKNTKAIFVVHYAGVSCEMDKIKEIAKRHNLPIVEDAAQGINAKYKDDYLGTLGTFGCYSFHETKNVICGEGGAIVINYEKYLNRAEIIREKGTDRSRFARGEVDKYTWHDIGSSFLPSDILAAFLLVQLENIDKISTIRKNIYDFYYQGLRDLEKEGKINLPVIPSDCSSNHHMFYLLLNSEKERNELIKFLRDRNITSVFHYIPLHNSPMGNKLGYKQGDLPITEEVSQRLVRLPFYNILTTDEQECVIDMVRKYFKGK